MDCPKAGLEPNPDCPNAGEEAAVKPELPNAGEEAAVKPELPKAGDGAGLFTSSGAGGDVLPNVVEPKADVPWLAKAPNPDAGLTKLELPPKAFVEPKPVPGFVSLVEGDAKEPKTPLEEGFFSISVD